VVDAEFWKYCAKHPAVEGHEKSAFTKQLPSKQRKAAVWNRCLAQMESLGRIQTKEPASNLRERGAKTLIYINPELRLKPSCGKDLDVGTKPESADV
jgi:hypothetical protein